MDDLKAKLQGPISEISVTQIIAWSGSTVIAALTLSAYAFSNFETKSDSKDHRADIEKRLDSITEQQREIINLLLQMKSNRK